MGKNILVIDGQGGMLGKQLTAAIIKAVPDCSVTAVGTNSTATSNMLKGGAHNAATGENAVIVGVRTADIIVGPVGIAIADSLLGEITPKMAVAVGQSLAKKVLLPMDKCNNFVVGTQGVPVSDLIAAAAEKVKELCEGHKKTC